MWSRHREQNRSTHSIELESYLQVWLPDRAADRAAEVAPRSYKVVTPGGIIGETEGIYWTADIRESSSNSNDTQTRPVTRYGLSEQKGTIIVM